MKFPPHLKRKKNSILRILNQSVWIAIAVVIDYTSRRINNFFKTLCDLFFYLAITRLVYNIIRFT